MSTTIEHDGFSIESNTESEAAMRAAMVTDAPTKDSDGPETPTHVSRAAEDDSTDDRAHADEAGASTDGTSEPGVSVPSERRAKPRDNPQARISQAVAKQHEAERKAADLEARLTALEQTRTPEPKETPKAAAAVTGKPSWKTFEGQIGEQFESWADAQDAYIDARDEWKEGQQREAYARQTREQVNHSHRERVETFKETHTDFDTALQAVGDIKVGAVLETAILELPNSADVVYWLATHRDDFLQLASETQGLDVVAAPIVKRLLEARVGAGVRSGAAPLTELSKARPPVRPVGVSSVIVPDDPGDDESFDRYFSRMNAADRKKGKL